MIHNEHYDVRYITVTPSSITSSIILGQIPEEVLRVWSQLPEAIRLDPSLAVFQREYDRVHQAIEGRWVFLKRALLKE